MLTTRAFGATGSTHPEAAGAVESSSPFVSGASSPQPVVAVVETSVAAPHSDEGVAVSSSGSPAGAATGFPPQVGATRAGAAGVKDSGVAPLVSPFA